jgi:hypothetical protein
MIGNRGALELGFANAAILMTLIEALIEKGVLSQTDARDVLRQAITQLQPQANIVSVKRAIEVITNDLLPRLPEEPGGQI